MLVDLLLVALLSGVSGFWLLGGLVLLVLQLRSQRGSATRKRQVVGWLGAGLLGLLILQDLQNDWLPRGQAAAEVDVGVETDPPAAAPVLFAGATPGAEPASAPSFEARVVQLEEELAQARKPLTWRQHWDRFMATVGLSFGWGLVYFSLLPAWWGGQTVGKKLFGLQVVELTGAPMTVMRCLKRYGGYAAGMATGGLGFATVLWEANRQGIQDKAAHTAVIDLRALTRRPAQAAPVAAALTMAAAVSDDPQQHPPG